MDNELTELQQKILNTLDSFLKRNEKPRLIDIVRVLYPVQNTLEVRKYSGRVRNALQTLQKKGLVTELAATKVIHGAKVYLPVK